jgi:hypothetical protein
MDGTQEPSNHKSPPKSSFNPEAELARAFPADQRAQVEAVLAGAEDYFVATGQHVRQLSADLEELRRLRLEAAGRSVFKRARSPYAQIRYRR